jgi:hypothetical protein
MPYQLIEWDTYPTTGLPIYRVYDADEYQDPAIAHPRPIGEAWGVGVRGVTGRYLQTGVRWQLAGAGLVEGTLIDEWAGPSTWSKAAHAIIAAYEAS